MPFDWTPEHISRLKALWPSNSTAEIGRQLGTSRRSVIGKAYRLGLPPHANINNIKYNDDLIRKIGALRDAGNSCKQVEKLLNIPYHFWNGYYYKRVGKL